VLKGSFQEAAPGVPRGGHAWTEEWKGRREVKSGKEGME
jgi:hypothetical protein